MKLIILFSFKFSSSITIVMESYHLPILTLAFCIKFCDVKNQVIQSLRIFFKKYLALNHEWMIIHMKGTKENFDRYSENMKYQMQLF